MIKKIIKFLICLLPWFLNNLIKVDYKYYELINKPFFAPPRIFYPISWTITYILIAITIYTIISSYKLKEINTSYKITLLINYICNESYIIVFFLLKNPLLGFISCLSTFLSTLFLKEETHLLNNKISNLLYPYILLSLFATILSLSIFLLNI